MTDNTVQEKLKSNRCLKQVQSLWRETDGNEEDRNLFCTKYKKEAPEEIRQLITYLEKKFQSIFGCFRELQHELAWELTVDDHSLPDSLEDIANIFSLYDPSSQFDEDMFNTKIAFLCLLNFEYHNLEEVNQLGNTWTREQWVQNKISKMFVDRIPTHLQTQSSQNDTLAQNYISAYNIFIGNIFDQNKIFPLDTPLICHWGIRDEIRAQYANSDDVGLPKQRVLAKVLSRVVDQSIPQCVINNKNFLWNVFNNEVSPISCDNWYKTDSEETKRYQFILDQFNIQKQIDPYTLEKKNAIHRHFEQEVNIPYSKVKEILLSILQAPILPNIANLLTNHLKRPLEEFDIYFQNFTLTQNKSINENELDEITLQLFPNAQAFENSIVDILKIMGFTDEKAKFISSKIKVDPAKGSGHASRASKKGECARLRTRIPSQGMLYKGFNIAMHELGHNVEQVISLELVDYQFLRSVPNTSFTEAFAFVFQSRSLHVLNALLKKNDSQKKLMVSQQPTNSAVTILWQCFEITGAAWVEIQIWEWLYKNPLATAYQLKEAALQIAKDTWNQFFYPIIGVKDSVILGAYSHMINHNLYLTNYSLGHIIEFQIENYLEGKVIGIEMERMCRLGSIAPEQWMQEAIGEVVSSEPLINAAHKELII